MAMMFSVISNIGESSGSEGGAGDTPRSVVQEHARSANTSTRRGIVAAMLKGRG